MSNSSTVSSSTTGPERFIGRVKWFNNKAGYGFITVTDGPKSDTDVFVHHSSIKVDSEQYKYLVQGEYVDFVLSDTKAGVHEYQAGDVCGIKGGKLMCETRNELRAARSQYKSTRPASQEDSPDSVPRSVAPPRYVAAPRSVVPPRARGQGPREDVDLSSSRRPGASSGRGRGRPSGSGRGRGQGQGQDRL